MTRTLIVVAALLTLSVPAALAVPPEGKGKPDKKSKQDKPAQSAAAPGQSADKNAAKKCKTERGTTAESIAAFKLKYSPNHPTGANAFGKCVSQTAKKLEAQAEAAAEARENAAKKCKTERGTTAESIAAFKLKYSPNHPTGANAFGKCVSMLAKSKSSS